MEENRIQPGQGPGEQPCPGRLPEGAGQIEHHPTAEDESEGIDDPGKQGEGSCVGKEPAPGGQQGRIKHSPVKGFALQVAFDHRLGQGEGFSPVQNRAQACRRLAVPGHETENIKGLEQEQSR